MNSLFLLCYAPRAAPISRAAFWQFRKRGIVLSGAKGEAEAHVKVPGKPVVKPEDLLLYSLEVAATEVLARRGFGLGHLSGHSSGTTVIEHPAVGAHTNTVLRENMILTFHPQVIDQDGKVCLYTQDTYRVGQKEGECLADVPWRFFAGEETRDNKN